MTLKGQKTAAEYIQWDRFKTYLRKTEIDGENKICLVSLFGAFFLMRIGDILELRWSDVLDEGHKGKNTLTITENKNRQRLSKKREIGVNGSVREVIERVYLAMGSPPLSTPIFLREDKSGVISRQYVNQKLKSVNTKYRLGLDRISSHSFRKTYARAYWESSGKSEASLRYLKNALGHRSIEDTEIYIGIRRDEIVQVYNSLSL